MKLTKLFIVTLLVASTSVFAHTPYRQWDVFRSRFLQIVTSKSDLPGDAIGDEWVSDLRSKLPESRALVSRAGSMEHLASLIKTDQAKLAIISYADAKAIQSGKPPFAEFNPIPLQVLVDNGTHLLVARDNLPLYHGYLITSALMQEPNRLHVKIPTNGKFGIPLHPGAKATADGEKIVAPVAKEQTVHNY